MMGELLGKKESQKQVMKDLIRELHAGVKLDTVKEERRNHQLSSRQKAARIC